MENIVFGSMNISDEIKNTLSKLKIVISTPNSKIIGGVRYYWESILPNLLNDMRLDIKVFERSGFKSKWFGFLYDQWMFFNYTKSVDLFVLNFSLVPKSFIRESIFAKRLVRKNIDFVVFIHGWQKKFDKEIENKYKSWFLNTIGKAKIIIVLSNDFKQRVIDFGYEGEVIVETTAVDSSLIRNFSINDKMDKISSKEKISILFLGRIVKEKGIFELVEAFMKLENEFNNIELIVAGDGKDFSTLEKLVRGSQKIKLIGYVEGQDKINVYKKNTIYCLPSYSEGLPITVLEAMLFGMPIITTRVGGLNDFFKDSKMGYFVKIGDSEDIENKLKLLIQDKDAIIRMGKRNHKFAQENFRSDIVADRLNSHIKNILIKN